MIAPQVRDAITAAVERKGVHCIDLVIRGDRGRPVIEIYVDAEQGITTDLCADVSREVAAAIEQANLIAGQYRLDVSSPGIDRPLKFLWQYPKHVGRRIQVRFRAEAGEQSVDGTLSAVGEGTITVQPKGAPEPVVVQFGEIVESRIPAPW
jgi:ribosome maturation factor RimP